LEFVAGEQENARAGISNSRIGKPPVPAGDSDGRRTIAHNDDKDISRGYLGGLLIPS